MSREEENAYDRKLLDKLIKEGTGRELSHEEYVANKKEQLAINDSNEEFWHSHEFWQEDE